MKVYKNAIIATGIITLISFLASFIFNFYTQVNSFWCMPCWAYLVAVC